MNDPYPDEWGGAPHGHGGVPITLPWATWPDFVAALQATVDPGRPASARELVAFHVTLQLPTDVAMAYLLAAKGAGLPIGHLLTMLVTYGAAALVRDAVDQGSHEGRIGLLQPPPAWGELPAPPPDEREPPDAG